MATGEKLPGGVKSSDGSGERVASKTNGVAKGSADCDPGRSTGGKERGEYNTGKSESVCYTHKKGGY